MNSRLKSTILNHYSFRTRTKHQLQKSWDQFIYLPLPSKQGTDNLQSSERNSPSSCTFVSIVSDVHVPTALNQGCSYEQGFPKYSTLRHLVAPSLPGEVKAGTRRKRTLAQSRERNNHSGLWNLLFKQPPSTLYTATCSPSLTLGMQSAYIPPLFTLNTDTICFLLG